MLLAGVLLGTCAVNVLDAPLLGISAELRQMALIVILLRAGLSLNIGDLRKVGRPALLMSCLPAACELLGYCLLAPRLLDVSLIEASLLGAVLSAVSPAVVVPRMLHLMETGYGTKQGVPQLIMAGASCDDIFVIVLFTTFLGMARGGQAQWLDFVNIPVSMLLGVALGCLTGLLLALLWRRRPMRSSIKLLIFLSTAFLMMAAESLCKQSGIALSGLLAVMSMACVCRIKCPAETTAHLSAKLGKVWLGAEVLLSGLLGAAVDIRYTMAAGLPAVLGILQTAPLGAICMDKSYRRLLAQA